MLVEAEKAMIVRGEEAPNLRGAVPLKHHFVLVHGIGGGSWCWYKIRCLMENSGYKVTCIDLKSSGIDRSDADSILSFNDYNKPLMDFMSDLPENEQVILVGHSAGGLSLTQASHKFARKIRLAIYVAATMLKLGFRTDQDQKDDEGYPTALFHKFTCSLKKTANYRCVTICLQRLTRNTQSVRLIACLYDNKGVPDLSEFGDVYELGFGLGYDKPPTSALVKKEFHRKIIYQLSPHEDSTLAGMLLRPGPVHALTSARFTEENSDVDKVPRVYIKTMQDHVMKPEQQEALIKRWPPSNVYVLDSDHSPFFSTPFLLFGLLVKAAVFDVACN